MRSLHPLRELRALGLLLLAVAAGCEGGRAATDYMPASNQARQAVEQMLEAWQTGEPVKEETRLAGNGPGVKLFDSQRGAKKLAKFEVVGETPAAANEPPQVAVKLTFSGEEKQVDAIYHVIGIDPLNVFRDIDYQQASGMSDR